MPGFSARYVSRILAPAICASSQCCVPAVRLCLGVTVPDVWRVLSLSSLPALCPRCSLVEVVAACWISPKQVSPVQIDENPCFFDTLWSFSFLYFLVLHHVHAARLARIRRCSAAARGGSWGAVPIASG